MSIPHQILKNRQRTEREGWPEFLSLRVHRALSWLDRAERCEDDDGCFIFLWVAFNAAYADEAGEYRLHEAARLQAFLARLVELDGAGRLESVLWEKFPGPIRVLLGNKYVFQPWWDHLTGSPTAPTGKSASSVPTGPPVMRLPTATPALGVVFVQLYTLRNQLIHGGATWNGSVNREQLRDARAIMSAFVPFIIEIMMDSAGEHWGEPCYPVHND